MIRNIRPNPLVVQSAHPDPPFDVMQDGLKTGFDVEMMRAVYRGLCPGVAAGRTCWQRFPELLRWSPRSDQRSRESYGSDRLDASVLDSRIHRAVKEHFQCGKTSRKNQRRLTILQSKPLLAGLLYGAEHEQQRWRCADRRFLKLPGQRDDRQWIARMPDKMAEAHLKLSVSTVRQAPKEKQGVIAG
jgi:hypothetical protein